MAHYIMRIRPNDVRAWEHKHGYSREDVVQEIETLLVTYIRSDKYEQHCKRREAEGEPPAQFATCLFSYAIAAFARVNRQERVIPSFSMDESRSGSEEGAARTRAETIEDMSTSGAPIEDMIDLLRRGNRPMSDEEAWLWWDEAFCLDGGDGLDREVMETMFDLPQEQLAALMLVSIFRIDSGVLAQVTGESTNALSLLVTRAQQFMQAPRASYVGVRPPQPKECFHGLCQVMQPDLFGEVNVEDWIDALEERLTGNKTSQVPQVALG